MIIFIPRQTDAIYFPEKDNPWSYSWVGFDGEKVDEYYVHLMFDGKECLAKISADKSILKGSKINSSLRSNFRKSKLLIIATSILGHVL